MNQQVPDELISAYFDGEVTREERGQVERLLKSSNDCRQLLDDTAKLSAILHSFPHESAPPQLAKYVQQHIAGLPLRPAGQSSGRLTLRREWMAFSAGIMATVASLLVWVLVNPTAELKKGAASAVALNEKPAPAAGGNPVALQIAPGANAAHAARTNKSLAPAAEALDVSAAALPVMNQDGQHVAVMSAALADQEGALVEELKLPQQKEEFLRSLRNGAVIEQHILNPNHVVMVVELTVVDINKGVEGLQLLMQKRNLHLIEESDHSEQTEGAESAKAGLPKTDEKTPAADGLVALYVRASGAELAAMLGETVGEHPELYQELTPQLPIGFPWKEAANPAIVAARDEDAKGHPKTEPAVAGEPRSVAVEANLVIQSFAMANGLAVDNSLNANFDILKQYQFRPTARFGTSPYARIGVINQELGAEEPSPAAEPEAGQPKPKAVEKSKSRLDAKRVDEPHGFAKFLLNVDKGSAANEEMSPGSPSQVPLNSDSVKKTTEGATGAVSVLSNSAGVPFNFSQSGLMRLLIVVKSPAAPSKP